MKCLYSIIEFQIGFDANLCFCGEVFFLLAHVTRCAFFSIPYLFGAFYFPWVATVAFLFSVKPLNGSNSHPGYDGVARAIFWLGGARS